MTAGIGDALRLASIACIAAHFVFMAMALAFEVAAIALGIACGRRGGLPRLRELVDVCVDASVLA